MSTDVAAYPADALARFKAGETELFTRRNRRSAALGARAAAHFPGGVPLHWMKDWGTPFPLTLDWARGAEVGDADGHRIADFCLGDSGAMYGHAPAELVAAISSAAADGLTAMAPSPDTGEVGDLLADAFGLPFYQITQTASDANRAVIRWARAITGRKTLVVIDGCYHGQVEDAFVRLGPDGATLAQPGLVGEVFDRTATSRAIVFNDLAAAEAALASGDVALVLAEPALTNTGLVLPAPGYLDGLAALCRRHGALLCLDETHTLSTARGGYARAHGLHPDFIVAGKAVAGGLPTAIFGFSAAVAEAMAEVDRRRPAGYSGIGTTLSGNRLQLAALKATLRHLMTDDNHARMSALATSAAAGIADAVRKRRLPWSVVTLGARLEVMASAEPPVTGAGARAALDHDLESALHLYLLNRDVLLTPFHNMMLMSPATRPSQVEALISAFAAGLDALAAA